MHILVTGANTPIGRQVVHALSAAHTVRATDRAFGPALESVNPVETVASDLRDTAFVTTVLAGIEAVVHCAPLAEHANELDALEDATAGTNHLLVESVRQGVSRFITASTLSLFDSLPENYLVSPGWRPRPQPRMRDICPYTAEIFTREHVRMTAMRGACIRFGVATAAQIADALQAALTNQKQHWFILHAGERPAPVRMPRTAPVPLKTGAPVKTVLVLGAGGPIGTTTVQALAPNYTLRVSDVRPWDDLVAAAQPQSPGAPVPQLISAPHETRVVDVSDPGQVMRACDGVDAIVNLTVMRHDPVQAWRVNALGAWNVMQAAVAHGIWRVVHTGPWQNGPSDASAYHWDYEVVDDVPPRPASAEFVIYLYAKLAGQEIARIFAEHYGLSVPAILFCGFVNPNVRPAGEDLWPFITTWMDAGRAIAAGVAAPALPSPFELLHAPSDTPHGVYPNTKIKRVLGWTPSDDLSKYWIKPA